VLVRMPRIPRHHAELPPRKGVHPRRGRRGEGKGCRSYGEMTRASQ